MNERFPLKRLALGAAALALLLAACGTRGGDTLSVGARPSLAVEGATIDGDEVSLLDLEGKPVMLHFFATWCGPCMGEFPIVQQAAKENAGKLTVLSVSLDTDAGKLRDFLESKGVDWPVIYSGDGWRDGIAQKLGVRSIPRIALLDAEGKVVADKLRGSSIKSEARKLASGG